MLSGDFFIWIIKYIQERSIKILVLEQNRKGLFFIDDKSNWNLRKRERTFDGFLIGISVSIQILFVAF